MPLIIGIAGKIGVGKTTTSDYLEQKYSFSEYSFAEPINKIGLAFEFESHQLYGTQRQKMEINEYWGCPPCIFFRSLAQIFVVIICPQLFPI
jgi:pantothenate kinase-related protein Tda10